MDYYYIYNIDQAKFIIKYTQDYSFTVGIGGKKDIYIRFLNTPSVREALTLWKNKE